MKLMLRAKRLDDGGDTVVESEDYGKISEHVYLTRFKINGTDYWVGTDRRDKPPNLTELDHRVRTDNAFLAQHNLRLCGVGDETVSLTLEQRVARLEERFLALASMLLHE